MGRVVPSNSWTNLLTRLLELERAGGYQVDQQARMNMALVPQYGGTVGGVRQRALEEVGGWRDDTLSEDTDVTYRLLLHGWLTVYQNRSECYEEVPETWPVRIRQIRRWARGHNQSLARYLLPLLRGHVRGGFWQRVDGVMLLGIYMVAPLYRGRLADGTGALLSRRSIDGEHRRGAGRRIVQHGRERRGLLRGRGRHETRRVPCAVPSPAVSGERLSGESRDRHAIALSGPDLSFRQAGAGVGQNGPLQGSQHMSPPVAIVALCAGVTVWAALPLLPAFIELYRRRDDAPLNVPPAHHRDLRHFAWVFRDYVRRQLALMDLRRSLVARTGACSFPMARRCTS